MNRSQMQKCIAVTGAVAGATLLTTNVHGQAADLVVGVPTPGAISVDGNADYYAITLPHDDHLIVTVNAVDRADDRYELYIQRDALPTREDYLAHSAEDCAGQALDLAAAPAATYYVMVYAADVWSWTGQYTVRADTTETMPILSPGTPLKSSITVSGNANYYLVTLAQEDHLVVTLNAGYNGDHFQLYLQKDSLPTRNSYLVSSTEYPAAQALDVADAKAGTYFVMFYAADVDFFSGEYTARADTDQTMPVLTPAEPVQASLTVNGNADYYKISLAKRDDLVVTLNAGYQGARFELCIDQGALPTRNSYLASSAENWASQAVNLPDAGPGVYYVLVYGADVWPSTGEYRVQVDTVDTLPSLPLGSQVVSSLTVDGNAGYYTISVPEEGAQLVVTLSAGHDDNRFEVYLDKGVLPGRNAYRVGSAENCAGQAVSLVEAEAGVYYVMVYAGDVEQWSSTGEYTVRADTTRTLPDLIAGEGEPNSITVGGNADYYTVTLEKNDYLVVTLSAEDADDRFELYLQQEAVPTRNSYLVSSNEKCAGQTVDVRGAEVGVYYVMVYAAELDSYSMGEYTIRAYYNDKMPALAFGAPMQGWLSVNGNADYYMTSLEKDGPLVVTLKTGEYDRRVFELYVQQGAVPTRNSYLSSSTENEGENLIGPTVDVQKAEAGIYYVMVYGADVWPRDEGYTVTVSNKPEEQPANGDGDDGQDSDGAGSSEALAEFCGSEILPALFAIGVVLGFLRLARRRSD